MTDKAELSKKLNEILSRTYDLINNYKYVLVDIHNPNLQEIIIEQTSHRERFIKDLTMQVSMFGEQAKTQDNYKEHLNRVWADLSSTAVVENEEEIIEECIRAEWSASYDYDDLLLKNIPVGSELNKIATNHRAIINQSLRKLEMLKKVHQD